MITLQCRLEFQNEQDREVVLDLMRRFSSAMRYAYQRLLEGEDRNELNKYLAKLFNINTRYAGNAILLAQSMLLSCRERTQNPKKVIFGSRELFKQLKKKHLNGKRREKLKTKWREVRQGNLYSRGDKGKHGNLNLRFQWIVNELYLRINVGHKQYIYAKVIRSVRRERDKWIDFMVMLEKASQTKEWFPYSVRLKLKNGKVYAFISFEEELPSITIKRDNGIIGIDVNAYPYHLALAVVSKDGNLEGYQSISLNELLESSSDKRQYLEWQVAHKVIELAKKEGKAIAIENLKKLPKGRRGDGFAKLRSRLQKWSYKRLLEKIEILARRSGIEVRKVNPAYTSVIGKLKYAPQFNIDKDVAGAFVIGRRGLGFRERLPKNYKRLLDDEEFLLYSMARVEEEIDKVKDKIKRENNPYKKNRLKTKLSKLKGNLKILSKHLQSGKSELASRQPGNLWKERVRGGVRTPLKSWQVLSAALAFSCLEKSYRDFSPLKRVIVLGDWAGVARRLVLVPGAGTAVLDKCSFIQLS
ncbi:MAG: IS200/IS605 family accessory protein TnpB-related protein [Thermofilum sp.]|uniref:IS200/IS605 family accessory protein TnpB-related protein n=1 Tax=Thermofilum sp. TaxID=1961369 RepID=UPI00258E7504|nr:IS200/IS605 family accessory protein TnpB-related protein [Thermofilum sp.]MCI4409110.1 IS200/IS605 family accessory protein TnpB-related protein [Thermofilum sp.]